MRWADIIAFFTTSFWVGCNIAFAIVPAVMFGQVKIHAVDATREEVGELFGQVAIRWGWLTLALLAVLFIARIIGWTVRLRRRRFTRVSLVGVMLFAGIAVFTVLAAGCYETVEKQRTDLADMEKDDPARPAAAAAFQQEHERSVRLSQIVTLLLLGQAGVLACSLARRSEPAPASVSGTAT